MGQTEIIFGGKRTCYLEWRFARDWLSSPFYFYRKMTENFDLLLDDEDAFLPHIAAKLTEIFNKFDVDQDGLFKGSELAEYFRATNGEDMGEDVKKEIEEAFDVDSDGNLTLKGFIEMYQLQTLADPDETLKDLMKHGFDIKATKKTKKSK
jgi:Ca2+-binding EF-hand superfamily protein